MLSCLKADSSRFAGGRQFFGRNTGAAYRVAENDGAVAIYYCNKGKPNHPGHCCLCTAAR